MITPSFSLTATERVLPKLALDFTTASLDSRVTFTRTGGTATVVDSSGTIVSAGVDVPRFDYDPVTLVCKGLLIEEARTNFLLYSETFSNTSWTYYATGVGQGSKVSPDGVNNAYKLTPNATSTQHLIESANVARTAQAYTISAYVYADGYSGFDVAWGASRLYANFNLATGQVVNAVSNGTDFSNASATITSFGGGFFRITLTGTAVTTTSHKVRFAINSTPTYTGNSGEVFTGDGTSGIYIWGAQLEAGAFATSYIPTTTTALTRNADVATMTGTNFSDWFNASEGTFVAEAQRYTDSPTTSASILSTAIGTTQNASMWMYADQTNSRFVNLAFDASAALVGSTAITAAGAPGTNVFTSAFGFKTDSYAGSVNGVNPVLDTSGTLSGTPDNMKIGVSRSGALPINGYIRKIAYYPQRLTNAEIQAFSK